MLELTKKQQLELEIQNNENGVTQTELRLKNAIGDFERAKERVRFLENDLTAWQAKKTQTQNIYNLFFPKDQPITEQEPQEVINSNEKPNGEE